MPRYMRSSPSEVHPSNYGSQSARHVSATARPETRAVAAVRQETTAQGGGHDPGWIIIVGMGAFLGWVALVMMLT